MHPRERRTTSHNLASSSTPGAFLGWQVPDPVTFSSDSRPAEASLTSLGSEGASLVLYVRITPAASSTPSCPQSAKQIGAGRPKSSQLCALFDSLEIVVLSSVQVPGSHESQAQPVHSSSPKLYNTKPPDQVITRFSLDCRACVSCIRATSLCNAHLADVNRSFVQSFWSPTTIPSQRHLQRNDKTNAILHRDCSGRE